MSQTITEHVTVRTVAKRGGTTHTRAHNIARAACPAWFEGGASMPADAADLLARALRADVITPRAARQLAADPAAVIDGAQALAALAALLLTIGGALAADGDQSGAQAA